MASLLRYTEHTLTSTVALRSVEMFVTLISVCISVIRISEFIGYFFGSQKSGYLKAKMRLLRLIAKIVAFQSVQMFVTLTDSCL